ncbi:MAG: hypothetical protein ABT02_07945 [Comamonadaceae bacterium SCN 68-20]|nr:MAG: hypothetical protein ABT02_07945 [Comamonadaceae bacterium SCN 68-20]
MPAVHEAGFIDAAGLARIPGFISNLGGNPHEVLRHCGIDASLFACAPTAHRQRLLPLSKAVSLVSLAAMHVGCPHLGLSLGMHLEHALLGPISLLMLHAPTVKASCEYLDRFLHLRAAGVRVHLSVAQDVASFSFELETPYGPDSDHIHDLSMASFVSFMKLACGSAWRPDTARLARSKPADEAPYRDLFGPMVRYEQSCSTLTFPASWLSQPVVSANPEIEQAMRECMLRLDAQHRGDVAGQIRRVLPSLLPSGNCTIERVSDLFAMHRRTLHRKLAQQGTTFEKLLDEARSDIAQRTLRLTDQSVKEVASLLGYRDVSAFSRAFCRWTGQRPAEWRVDSHRGASSLHNRRDEIPPHDAARWQPPALD